jgi:methyltransferase-like protein
VDSYDEIPYDSSPVTETDPDRLAVIGRLFGLEAADPRGCSVLELGCASGGNLIPLAWRYPRSRFVGVELSARQASDGRRMIERLGLTNIEIRQADILSLGEDLGEFDYILCHGVYSWVPEAVRERILDLFAGQLTSRGIAYISYNTLPGWRMRGMLRDMLLYHTRGSSLPGERLDVARGFLDLFEHATIGLDALHVKQIKQQIARIREAPPSYLYHEYLEALNEPCLFSDFATRFETRGLGYLGDAELHTMFPSTLGDAVDEAVDGIDDAIEQEQYLDFVRNRGFRQTLLCRADALPDRVVDLELFERLAFFADLIPPKKVDLRRPKSQPFRRPGGEEPLNIEHPLTKAAVIELARRYPDAVAFGDLVRMAGAAVADTGGRQHADALDHLFGEFFSLYLHQGVGASIHASALPRAGSRPRTTDLARLQVAEGLGHVATARHTQLDLDPLAERLLMLLDGSRTVEEIVEDLTVEADRQDRSLFGAAGLSGNPEKRRAQIRTNCERLVSLFARQGILEE